MSDPTGLFWRLLGKHQATPGSLAVAVVVVFAVEYAVLSLLGPLFPMGASGLLELASKWGATLSMTLAITAVSLAANGMVLLSGGYLVGGMSRGMENAAGLTLGLVWAMVVFGRHLDATRFTPGLPAYAVAINAAIPLVFTCSGAAVRWSGVNLLRRV